jgi:argininosuccinate lyase
MSIYKALPFTYNRDFQEMNSLLYESLEIAISSANLMAKMLNKIDFKADVMAKKAGKKFTVATELANMLVRKAGIPFRTAHEIVGKLASEEIYEPEIEDLDRIAMEIIGRRISEFISKDDLNNALNPANVVESMKNLGGTAKKQIERMLEERISLLSAEENELSSLIDKVSSGIENLYSEVKKVIE